jgi:hypothetical protein
MSLLYPSILGISHANGIGGRLNRDRKWTDISGYFSEQAVISGYFGIDGDQ